MPKALAASHDSRPCKQALEVLDLRERLIFKLGAFAGMRCSEIFGLRRGRAKGDHVEVVERVSRRDIDTPKTAKSVRKVALSSPVVDDLDRWLRSRPGGPDDWVFPSENMEMPMGADNMMARHHFQIRAFGKVGGYTDWMDSKTFICT